jgi:hypothetical protein
MKIITSTSNDCADCGESATKRWDLGQQHAFWVGYRYESVCDACYQDRDNWEPGEPDYDAPTAQETHRHAWEEKQRLG